VHSRYEIVEQHEVDGQVAHHVRRVFPGVIADRAIAEDVPGYAGTDVAGSDVTVELGGPRDVGADAVLDQGSEGDRMGGAGGMVEHISALGLGTEWGLVIVSSLGLALLARS